MKPCLGGHVISADMKDVLGQCENNYLSLLLVFIVHFATVLVVQGNCM